MQVSANTLDDLLRKLLPKLLTGAVRTSPGRGSASERFGVLLELRNPLARLSRSETRGKTFSCLGEFLWYMSRDNRLDFIHYYIPRYEKETEDGETVYGGYGPRLFGQRGHDQIRNAIQALKTRPDSRRIVIQIFNAEDVAQRHKEVPCTCTLQFLLRDSKLHMLTSMRSNDVYMGLPHDIFCFTMIQEIIARTIGVKLGTYKQFVGSLHLYDDDREVAQEYLAEAVQATVLMPPMPIGDPWPSLRRVLEAEYKIRNGIEFDPSIWNLDSYWADLIRLLQIYAASGDVVTIEALQSKMVHHRYAPYIEPRKAMTRRTAPPERQLLLPL